MKIVITGHTKGIGKGLHTELSNLGHTVIGFSKSNGYDVTSADIRKKIIEESQDCDMFINNAYPGQNEMFQDVFDVFKLDETKTIVNIVSFLKYREFIPFADEYRIRKNTLYKSMLKQTFIKEKKCRLISINPGYVDTDMVKNLNIKKLTVEESTSLILWAILQPQHIEIGELSFWVTNHI